MSTFLALTVYSLITGSIYALVAAGLALTYGLMRVLNFAHGHLMMLGAYIFYLGAVVWEWSILGTSLFALVAMGVIAILVMKSFVEPFSRYSTMLTFVTTLALATLLEGIVSMVFGVSVKALDRGAQIESVEIYPEVYVTSFQIGIVISTIVVLFLLGRFIHGTPLGRRIRALAEHSAAGEGLGIARKRLVTIVFVLSFYLAGLAGVLHGYETNIQPTMGGVFTIKAFAAMVLGGLGNVWGAVMGAYFLGFVENFSIGLDLGGVHLPAGYKDAFAFVIILLVLLFRPQGLFQLGRRSS